MNAPSGKAGGRVAETYRTQEILSMNPAQVISKTYELGIQACREKDSEKVSRVLVELINALNFDQREVATASGTRASFT